MIRVDKKAEKEILNLDKTIQKRIAKFIDRLEACVDPRIQGKGLIGPLKHLWRYRVGDYRILCKIEDKIVEILVVSVNHRKKVYK
jgi:mRNA interferase RelE/StbE